MTPLFHSRFEEILFWVAVLVGFLVPLLYFVRWSRRNAASTKTRPSKDVKTITNFVLIPVAVIAILLGYARIGTLPHGTFYAGLAIFLSGPALTVWGYRTLGRFFSPDVQVQGDHKVVDRGPYRLLRHPGYAGVLFGLIGLGLAVQSWCHCCYCYSQRTLPSRIELESKKSSWLPSWGMTTSATRPEPSVWFPMSGERDEVTK